MSAIQAPYSSQVTCNEPAGGHLSAGSVYAYPNALRNRQDPRINHEGPLHEHISNSYLERLEIELS